MSKIGRFQALKSSNVELVTLLRAHFCQDKLSEPLHFFRCVCMGSHTITWRFRTKKIVKIRFVFCYLLRYRRQILSRISLQSQCKYCTMIMNTVLLSAYSNVFVNFFYSVGKHLNKVYLKNKVVMLVWKKKFFSTTDFFFSVLYFMLFPCCDQWTTVLPTLSCFLRHFLLHI